MVLVSYANLGINRSLISLINAERCFWQAKACCGKAQKIKFVFTCINDKLLVKYCRKFAFLKNVYIC